MRICLVVGVPLVAPVLWPAVLSCAVVLLLLCFSLAVALFLWAFVAGVVCVPICVCLVVGLLFSCSGVSLWLCLLVPWLSL